MHLQITPEPTPEEREAIEQALRRSAIGTRGPEPDPSPWWRAGLEEQLATADLDG